MNEKRVQSTGLNLCHVQESRIKNNAKLQLNSVLITEYKHAFFIESSLFATTTVVYSAYMLHGIFKVARLEKWFVKNAKSRARQNNQQFDSLARTVCTTYGFLSKIPHLLWLRLPAADQLQSDKYVCEQNWAWKANLLQCCFFIIFAKAHLTTHHNNTLLTLERLLITDVVIFSRPIANIELPLKCVSRRKGRII